MELCDVLENVEYEIIQYGKKSLDILGVTIDSRNVGEGFVFVCISGFNSDGHDFIESAANNGATVVVCQREDVHFPPDITAVLVKSTRHALNTLAGNFYGNPAKRMRIIGVTGTNGKTSVTYFLEKILEECGYTVGIIGTSGIVAKGEVLNIKYKTSTTPDTIELHAIFAEMAMRGVNYVLMEVTSHALALDKVGSVSFDAGIFTNFTQDHLDFHKTMENYLKAKASLFDICALGIINADDVASAGFLKEYARIDMLSYGINNGDYLAKNIEFSAEGTSFDVEHNGITSRFTLNVPGRFTLYNALACIATALEINMPLEKVISGVSKITGVPGRLQSVSNKRGISVIIDYAHTPDAIENIIKTVREFTKGRIITLFGCGGDRDREKRPIIGKISGKLSDFCVLTSDNPRNEVPENIIEEIEKGIITTGTDYIKETDRKKAIFAALEMAKSGDSVILAGKGSEDYQEFENGRRVHFDDVETVRSFD